MFWIFFKSNATKKILSLLNLELIKFKERILNKKMKCMQACYQLF